MFLHAFSKSNSKEMSEWAVGIFIYMPVSYALRTKDSERKVPLSMFEVMQLEAE